MGYYRDEEKTREAWHDGLYHTGDTAWMDEDGYYWYVGRTDDVIKASGYRIGPFEIESVLMEHPAVLECAVTGAPDPVRGQVVKATIVLTKNYVPSEQLVKELQTYVKKQTAPYKYPRIVEFVEELPKTISERSAGSIFGKPAKNLTNNIQVIYKTGQMNFIKLRFCLKNLQGGNGRFRCRSFYNINNICRTKIK